MNIVGSISQHYSKNPVIRSLLQLIPGWGSADTLLQQRANEIRQERLRAFFDELANLEHELTEELIKSEDFLHCYFSTIKAVISTRRREKIALFAKLFRGGVLKKKISIDAYDELLGLLDELSFREIQMLYKMEEYEKEHNDIFIEIPNWSDGKYRLSISGEAFEKLFEGLKEKIANELEINRSHIIPMLIRLTRSGLLGRITSVSDNQDHDYTPGPEECLRLSPLYYELRRIVEDADEEGKSARGRTKLTD